MPYEIYKTLHILGIVLFFSQYAVAAYTKSSYKLQSALTGVALVLIIVSGMGIMARIGIPHNQWPLWIKAKFGIWLVVGMTSHMVLKRFKQFSVVYFWSLFAFLTAAAYLAITKVS